MHSINNMWHKIGRIKFVQNKNDKGITKMKGQLNVDNYVINKLNKLKCGPLLSIISNTWVDF